MSRLAEIDPAPWALALLSAAGLIVQIASPAVTPEIAPEAVIRPRIGADAPAPSIPAYPEISRQMIFTPDRARGVSAAFADAPPTLVGVAAMGRRVSTVLRTADGVDHVVEVGGEAAGWRLVSADDDHAVLKRGDAAFSVKLGGGASAEPSSAPRSPLAAATPAPPTTRPVRAGATQ